MSFEYFVAKKYFKAKRRTGFISLITFVSIIGVVIGVTALILVLSVMNGFEEEVWLDQCSSSIGHAGLGSAHCLCPEAYTHT